MKQQNVHHSDSVRIALVGLGGHGRTIRNAAGAAAGLEVVAVYDVAEAEAEAAAKQLGCTVAPSYEALLARDDLDAVALVTPNHLHRQQAEAAFAAGLAVFVEKPIANTVADGIAIAEAAERHGLPLMVGHNMRFGRATQKARQFLEEGRLGEIVSVEIHFSADSTRHLPEDAWRLRPDQCPLLPVMQLGIHAIDLVHYLLGPIEEVQAYARAVTTRPAVVDSVAASFRMEQGMLGTMVSNYCTQVRFAYEIAGTEGTLRCTPHRCWFRRTEDTDERGDGTAKGYDYTEHDRESYRLQMEAFARAVRQEEQPEVDGWAGLQALAVVEALERSVEARTPQRVASFREKPSTMIERNCPAAEEACKP